MKILYLANNLSVPGGIQSHNKAFIEVLRSLDNSVKLIELTQPSYFRKCFFIARVLFTFIKDKPQLIITGHVNFSPLCFFAKKLFGSAYVVTAHGVDVWELKSKLKILALKNADAIISVSHYTAGRLRSEIVGMHSRVVVIPNTVDSKRFTIKKKSRELIMQYDISGKKIILTVARLSAEEGHKGYEKVIQALPDVLKRVPDAHYVLVGDGSDKVRMERLVAKLGLSHHVTFAGRVSDDLLPDYYNLADVFVMPSTWEGFGIVFIESTACGIPVIAGNKDGSVDAVLNGELGLLINPDSIKEVGEATIKMLSGHANEIFYNKELLRRKTIEAFGLEKFRKKIESLLETLIDKKPI